MADPRSRRLARILLVVVPLFLVATAAVLLVTRPRTPPEEHLARQIPPSYAGLTAPMPAPPPGIEAVYQRHCASCHGESGKGDGPASIALVPQPAPFERPEFLAQRSDAYLYWRITEGRRGSAMPAFEQTLSDEQRWGLVLYLRQRWGRQAGGP